MKIFIKKYWTHFINLGFLVFTNILFLILYYNIFDKLYIPSLIILNIFVIFIWIEIIYHIVYIVKHKEINDKPLHIILSYMFNIFYIPGFSLKYISKDKKYKTKNIIYIIISILLFISLFAIIFLTAINNTIKGNTYTSDDGVVNFILPSDYEKTTIGEYDLFFTSENANIGIFIYDNYDTTAKIVLDKQENYLINSRESMKLIDSNIINKEKKSITTHTYTGKYKSTQYIYNLSTIVFDDKPDYIIYIIEITKKKNYNNIKKELDKILEDVVLNK